MNVFSKLVIFLLKTNIDDIFTKKKKKRYRYPTCQEFFVLLQLRFHVFMPIQILGL